MIHANDFKFASVLASAFTPNHSEFSQSSILAHVLGAFPKRYYGEVNAIPLPAEAAAEVNRIQLSGGEWRFGAAPARLNSQWDGDSDQSRVVTECYETIEKIIESAGVHVGRLAIVITRYCPADAPAQELIDKFCNEAAKDLESSQAPLRNSKGFQIHNHKQYPTRIGLSINSWVRCKSGIHNPTKSSIVVVEQDINTLSEEMADRRFTAQEARQFFEFAQTEANKILQLYFPN